MNDPKSSHFAHAGSPDDKAQAAEYDKGPYAGLPDQSLKGLAALEPAAADAGAVAEAVVKAATRPSASDHSARMSTRRRMAARSSMA